MQLAWFPKVRYYLVSDIINNLYINTVLWLVFNYFDYFDQFRFVFETVDSCLSVSHFMHEESFEADTLDLVHRILFKVSRPNKLSHNCLSQDPHTCRLFFVFFVLVYGWVPGTEEVKTDKGKTHKRVATGNREQACTVEGAIVWQINKHRNEGNTV